MRTGLISACLISVALPVAAENASAEQPSSQGSLDIGSRLELFVDEYLIESMDGVRLKLHRPRSAGKVLTFDKPWEGRYAFYMTLIHANDKYQLFYRGKTAMTNAGNPDEVTCYAESVDGVHWTKPNLGLFKVHGTYENNVILDSSFAPVCHDFSPFLDTRPGVPAHERYKALGGTFPFWARKEPDSGGLLALVSPDGIHWRHFAEKAVIGVSLHPAEATDTCMPSTFWSQTEQQYVSYVRVWKNFGKEKLRKKFTGDTRWIGRTTSTDFANWTPIQMMEYREDGFPHQLYLASPTRSPISELPISIWPSPLVSVTRDRSSLPSRVERWACPRVAGAMSRTQYS